MTRATPPASFQTISERPGEGLTCDRCTYWSRWLERTGDCMAYAYKRRIAMLAGDWNLEAWPQRSAHCTSATMGCEHFEREPDQ